MRTLVVNLASNPDFDVYCGRAANCPPGFKGDGADGYYSNPFVITRGTPRPDALRVLVRVKPADTIGYTIGVPTRADAIDCYRVLFADRVETDPEFVRRVLALRGRVLACFCVPLPCHVSDVLVPWINSYKEA